MKAECRNSFLDLSDLTEMLIVKKLQWAFSCDFTSVITGFFTVLCTLQEVQEFQTILTDSDFVITGFFTVLCTLQEVQEFQTILTDSDFVLQSVK